VCGRWSHRRPPFHHDVEAAFVAAHAGRRRPRSVGLRSAGAPALHHQRRRGGPAPRGQGREEGPHDGSAHQVIHWLTGFDEAALEGHPAAGTTFEDFFAAAQLHPHAADITGTICGVRLETIQDPLMQQIRYLDKLVDELAKGRPMEKVLRT
jgi:hypothetical protein